MTLLAFVVAVAFLATVAAVPVIARFAFSRRLLDFPDGARRSHAAAVPRLGGVAVFFGLLCAAAAGIIIGPMHLAPNARALLAACSILFGIGLVDDLRGVPPILKLLGQTLAALIVCQDGFAIRVLDFPPNYAVHLGYLAVPITVLWLVGVSNAFNLIDGLDGLAGGVGVIVVAAIGASSAVLGNATVPFYAAALGGALLGFLRYNRPPARIFLGDSGSLVVGFLLAFLAVKGATRADGTLLTVVPIFALSYPLLDTGISMLRRWLRGHPLSRADGRHIHHQLRALGLSPRRALAVVFAQSAGVAALGLCVTFAPPAATLAVTAAGGAIFVLIFVYGIRWLQYHEFLEAGTIVASAGARMRGAIRDTISARDISQVITTAGTFEHLNAILEDAADLFRFSHMQVGPPVATTPAHVLADMPIPRVWKAEYPIITEGGESLEDEVGRPMFLTIWCSTAARVRAASVERVAEIVAPAIATWSVYAGATLLRRTAPRPVHTPALSHRVVPGRVPSDLTVSRQYARERLPLH
jgi:UDP-GlcNAc:undecaprenyl-phosphate GlcNAc-1-phosphate transferase